MLVGLAPGVPEEAQFARRLAENGCRVIVPVLIDRKDDWSGNPALGRMTNQPHREFIYRMAYEMGRHVIGYEVQKVLAAVDWFCLDKDHPPVGVIGYGEGGLLALYAGAVDARIDTTVVSGYFGPREELWQEPIYRNVWGLLREFGDAELAATCSIGRAAPVDERVTAADRRRPGARRGRAAGGTARPVGRRAGRLIAAAGRGGSCAKLQVAALASRPRYRTPDLLPWSSRRRARPDVRLSTERPRQRLAQRTRSRPASRRPTCARTSTPPSAQHRQFDQLVAFTQKLLRDSERSREETFWSKLDTSSVEKYEASMQAVPQAAGEEVIGKLPDADRADEPAHAAALRRAEVDRATR